MLTGFRIGRFRMMAAGAPTYKSRLASNAVSSNYLYLCCLKKTLAILLLFIYLFSLAGYSFLFRYLMHRSDTELLQAIDAGSYDKGDVVILKTPMHLPYYTGSSEFERVEGEVEIGGTHYTYIQRRVSNDTLYVACLLNKEKTVLSKSKEGFAKEAAAPAENKKDTRSAGKKTVFGSEYPGPEPGYSFISPYSSAAQKACTLLQKPASGFASSPYTPPDFI